MNRSLTIDAGRMPLGAFTWIAECADGTQLIEWETDQPQLSFDVVAPRDDVRHVWLIPVRGGTTRIRVDVQDGEWVEKKWVRTFHVVGAEQTEDMVVDTVRLVSPHHIYHHCYGDGLIVITSNPEP